MIVSHFLSCLILLVTAAYAKPWYPWSATIWTFAQPATPCLTDEQAQQIASRYLSTYNTGVITSLTDLTGIVAANFTSYDETGTGPYSDGPATVGIDAFYASLTASGPSPFTNATQTVLFAVHDCDSIAYRWKFVGYATGPNS